MKNIFLVILITLALLGCKKENPSEINNDFIEDINDNNIENIGISKNNDESFAFMIYGNELLTSFNMLNSLYISYPVWTYEFNDNNIAYWAAATINYDGSIKDQEINLTGIYNIENNNNINFLNIEWNNNQSEKYLVLYNNNLCFLYKNNENMHFRGFRITNAMPGEFCASVDRNHIQIESSSHLTENGVIYSTGNLNEILDICWAEGVPGYGINETLFINTESYPGVSSIHISIGYVSYDRTYLYNENSRPKRIELTVDNKYSIIIDLDDTPNFQTVTLPETLNRNEILKLRIIEVYPGTKYEDTCINMILLDSAIY